MRRRVWPISGTTRELYDWGLTAAGFDVYTADDGASATAAMATHTPAIALSEVRLPDLDAFLTRCADARVPVIALTTDAFADHDALPCDEFHFRPAEAVPSRRGGESDPRRAYSSLRDRVSRSSRHGSCTFLPYGTAIRISPAARVDCR
jgi:hypothetical protein